MMRKILKFDVFMKVSIFSLMQSETIPNVDLFQYYVIRYLFSVGAVIRE